jgi:hypothetical protein
LVNAHFATKTGFACFSGYPNVFTVESVVFAFSVKQNCVVFSWEPLFASATNRKMPDNLILEILIPKQIVTVQQHLYVMCSTPIKVVIETACIAQYPMQFN